MNAIEVKRSGLRTCAALGAVVGALVFGGPVGAEPTVVQSADDAAVKWFECGGAWPQKGCEANLVWGDWEKSMSGWWVRAPKGHTFVRHAHSSPERILLVRGRMVGAIDGGQEVSVKPGMYWEIGGRVVHWARCVDSCLMYITYDSPFDLHFQP